MECHLLDLIAQVSVIALVSWEKEKNQSQTTDRNSTSIWAARPSRRRIWPRTGADALARAEFWKICKKVFSSAL